MVNSTILIYNTGFKVIVFLISPYVYMKFNTFQFPLWCAIEMVPLYQSDCPSVVVVHPTTIENLGEVNGLQLSPTVISLSVVNRTLCIHRLPFPLFTLFSYSITRF